MSDKYTPELLEQIRTGWKRLGGKYTSTELARQLKLESRNCIMSAARRYGLAPSRETALKSARAARTFATQQAQQELEQTSDNGPGTNSREIISLGLGQTYNSQKLKISPAWPEPLPALQKTNTKRR
jgi:hypothetical protein